ncbi:MAG: type II toxin-antitoxin system HicB family antitoxin [Fimbriimonadaceae bacterium]
MKIKVVIHEAEEGGYWAEVPSLPGCFTQGETMEEIEFNLREAIEGVLAARYDMAQVEPGGRTLEIAV